MNFLEWLSSKGYSDGEIGEINNTLIKNQYAYISAVQLAVQYIEENIIVGNPPHKTKREMRKEKTADMYNTLFQTHKDWSHTKIVRAIAKELRVNEDCIYTYLRELKIFGVSNNSSIHSIQNTKSTNDFSRTQKKETI